MIQAILSILLIYACLGAITGLIFYVIACWKWGNNSKVSEKIGHFISLVDAHPFWYMGTSAVIWPVYFKWLLVG